MNGTKITIIRPKKTFSWNDIKEIWQYKELLYFFTWRDLKVRYKQTAVGVLWAIFQPFMTMVVFSIFFGKLAQMPSDGIPYPIFVYTGLLLWQFFSSALSETSSCLISNQAIITKVYFPRLILPISSVLTKLVDFAIASVILVGLMAYYNYLPNLTGLLIIPLLLLITFMAAVGFGLFLAAVNVKYRDVRYALPFFIQMMMFVTPVIYPASIAGKYSWILAINPMTGVIKAARAAILGNAPINWELLLISGIACLIMLIIGVIYFKKTERYFADVV
ncbi:ABC transporter permease [Patescibacteria group bacterium]|nr:ABC transporter permease [Candidatus Falkowbacteria bacterium]MBU3906141.1 ABC transporter permease [Patescibacteria group bacterium]MCG2697632.1 ABC transporter permease [Candidatus Parcubacteria bacterium]MBU4026634.1 ABC transporter permease [Patescibacteria group bacterium]MBU4073533.1 ABC transporter permease [Patescibacteria group bacterium]